MVDYTKDVMRDETWRRWKGGTKLAEDLRRFYTHPRVFARLAEQNPMGPSLPSSAEKVRRKTMSQQRLGRGRGSDGFVRRRSALVAQMLSNRSKEEETAAARQSGATLP